MRYDAPLAVLKGVIEHGDPGVYFGSFIALTLHCDLARRAGWLDEHGAVTAAGRDVYTRYGLNRLPREGRAYMWDWSTIGDER